MSQKQAQTAGDTKDGTAGSVRRARERMEANLPLRYPAVPAQTAPEDSTRAFREPRAAPRPPSTQYGLPRNPGPSQSQGPKGPRQNVGTISKPIAQSPQWPLNGGLNRLAQSRSNQQYLIPQPGRSRQIPQQQSPYSLSNIQEQYANYQPPTAQYQNTAPLRLPPRRKTDEHVESPTSVSASTPRTPASRTSTISSVGSIPDFPLPVQMNATGPPRRSTNFGPPPTSRRGASSYYSNASFVSPIPEESDRSRSHGSYASSNAIPSSWGDDSPRFQFNEAESPRIEDDAFEEEEGRKSRDSHFDDNEEQSLVRSASLGKRAKPQLITTRSSSGEKTEQLQRAQLEIANVRAKTAQDIAKAMLGATVGAQAASKPPQAAGSRATVWPGLDDNKENIPPQSTDRIAQAVTLDDDTGNRTQQEQSSSANNPPSRSPDSGLARADSETRGYSRMSAIRRPPQLDMMAIKEADKRGSLTSLPDLIKRATRLAAMMEKGKRPASRLDDMSGFPSDEELGRAKPVARDARPASGISGMLAAFPSPLAVPQTEKPRRDSFWPVYGSDFGRSTPLARPPQKPPRRCCGLPLGWFIVMLFILACIIAAAVVVPLELLVFNKKSSANTAQSALSSCQSNTTCANGGIVTATDNVCSCICTNGFMGSNCTIAGSDGCTTMSLNSTSGALTNATLGTAIPRLVAQAQTNYSISLSTETILARFNEANLSCVAENALVTFDGLSSSSGNEQAAVSTSAAAATTTAAAVRRDTTISISYNPTVAVSVITIGGSAPSSVNPTITHDTSAMTATSASRSQSTTSSTTTRTTHGPASTSSGSFIVTDEVLDFARVATLLVLQEKSLNAAISAQNAIQHFLSTDSALLTTESASNVTIGTNESIDLYDFRVDLGGSLEGNVARRAVRFDKGQLCKGTTFWS